MGTTQPAPDRPSSATLVARARRPEPGQPRLWGRLLAAGVTVVLVAALVPSARADSDGGDSTLVPVDPPAEDAVTEVPAPAEVPAPEHGSPAVAATDDDRD